MPTEITPDLLFAEKPAGVPSHRPSPEHMGFVEWLEQQTQSSLKICHRLDKETSGAMLFAMSKQAAAQLTDIFSSRRMQKEYYFVSSAPSLHEKWVVVEDKAKGTLIKECPWQEEGDPSIISLTEFEKLSAEGQFCLYKAKPLTGKTHQVRKHATHSKIPILGDETYGGDRFPRLMLHCYQLKFQWQGQPMTVNSPLPRLFKHLRECEDQQWARWVKAIERRQRLFGSWLHSPQALRLIHTDSEDLRVDQAGGKMILGWWQKETPTEAEKNKIVRLMECYDFNPWVFQWRPGAQDKNSTELLLHSSESALRDWTFEENGVKYQGSLQRGQNFGLFLDQRQRRRWIQEHSRHKKVLNLFAFTGGFSINAALGGAQEVVTVDLFAKYLEWGKENFKLNQLDPEDSRYQWRRMDSLDYLNFAKKKGIVFDRIICDPPSFSRNKKSKKVFRVERDYSALIEACLHCLEPGGVLLFSTNYEKWDLQKWQTRLQELCQTLPVQELLTSPTQWDFEFQNQDAILKAFYLTKS